MSPRTVRWREALARHGSALALYLGLALLMTWPLPLQATTAVPGNGFDTWQNMWNMLGAELPLPAESRRSRRRGGAARAPDRGADLF